MSKNRTPKRRIERGKLYRRLSLIGLTLAVLLLPGQALGATKTWDGGCGADNSWSCAANWNPNAVPSAADTAAFSAKSKGASIVDPAFGGEVATVKLAAGYTGTVTLHRSLTVSKSFSQAGGNFAAGENDLTLRTLALSGGSFEASSSTTSISGNLTITGTPSFDANGGTIDFSGTGGLLRCGGVVFHLVVFSNAPGTKTVGGDCTLPLGANPVVGSGSIKLTGTLTGTGVLSTAGTLTLGSGGGLFGFTSLTANAVVVNGTYDFGHYDSVDVNGKFVVNAGGILTASPGTSSFQSDFTIDPGAVFDANGGTVEFDGGTNGRLSCGNQTFNLVRVSNTARMKTINADCALPLGADPTLGGSESGQVMLYGTLSGSGTVTAESTLTIGSTGHMSGFDGLSARAALVMSGASADFSSFKSFRVDGNYRQTGGSASVPSGADFNGQFVLKTGSAFEAPGGNMSVARELTIGPGATFDANGGTLSIDGNQGAVLSCGNATFSHVTFSHTANTKLVESNCSLPLGSNPIAGGGGSILLKGSLSGSGTLTTSGVLTVEGVAALVGFSGLKADDLSVNTNCSFSPYAPFTIGGDLQIGSGGDLVAPGGIASVGGDFVNGGKFLANGGTVVLDGSHQAIYGDTSFATLRKVASSTDTLTFEAGATQTVAGSLELRGGDWEHLLTLASSSPGGSWRIDRAGTAEVEFVSVADSTNVGTPITAPESFNVGGNSGWNIFGQAATLALEAQSAAPTAGSTDNLTIAVKDAYGNTVISYAGTHNLTFGPVADSPSGAHATVTNSSGSAVNFGTVTPISFTNGVASVSSGKNGSMTLVKAGSTSITVTDGSITNGSGLAVTVSPGPAATLALEAATATPTAGATDSLTITAKDSYGNVATSYTGTHNLTFGPVADSPSGAHATVTNSSGSAVNFGTVTPISFTNGVASVSSGKNGSMTLVKAGSTSITVTDGSISNGSGLAVTVSPGTAATLALEAATATPSAGATDNLTITAKDSYGNTATAYTGTHDLTFGPVADSPSGAHATVTNFAGGTNNFGVPTQIGFTNGVASVSAGKNGAMTLVKAGSASITVSDGSISNGSGLAVTVSVGAPARIAWTHATVSKGILSSPCLFTCTGTEMSSTGTFKANVSITDGSGNTVSGLGSGHTVSVTAASGTITGGTLTISTSGPAESTTQFTYASSKGGAVPLTAATASGTVYTSATATMMR